MGTGKKFPQEMVPYRCNLASTGYRLCIDGLPPSASWQDLKDHSRNVLGNKPVYTAVFEEKGFTVGIVELDNHGRNFLTLIRSRIHNLRNNYSARLWGKK